jgi:hypothetical protein
MKPTLMLGILLMFSVIIVYGYKQRAKQQHNQPVAVQPEKQQSDKQRVIAISFVYGSLTTSNFFRNGAHTKEMCELLDEVDAAAISMGDQYDMQFVDSLNDMNKLREACK